MSSKSCCKKLIIKCRSYDILTRISRILQSSYQWSILTTTIFLSFRIGSIFFSIQQFTLDEWYNDLVLFMMSNQFLYKKIHWNCTRDLIQSEKDNCNILLFFFIALSVYIFVHETSTFYISPSVLQDMSDIDILIVSIACGYFFITQLFSIIHIYEKLKKKGTVVHFFKYVLLLLYIFSGNIMSIFGKIQETTIYHIHHWILAVFFMVLTDLYQPYHTTTQYLNYAIYIHGVAMYGYDAIVK